MLVEVTPAPSAPLAALQPTSVTIGVEDVAFAAPALVCAAGLTVLAVGDGRVSLGDPVTRRLLVVLVDSDRLGPDTITEARITRLTFGVPTDAELRAAATVSWRRGARFLRALDHGYATALHLEGPNGIEIALHHEYAERPAAPGPALAFPPQRLLGCSARRESRRTLVRVDVRESAYDEGTEPAVLLRTSVPGLA